MPAVLAERPYSRRIPPTAPTDVQTFAPKSVPATSPTFAPTCFPTSEAPPVTVSCRVKAYGDEIVYCGCCVTVEDDDNECVDKFLTDI